MSETKVFILGTTLWWDRFMVVLIRVIFSLGWDVVMALHFNTCVLCNSVSIQFISWDLVIFSRNIWKSCWRVFFLNEIRLICIISLCLTYVILINCFSRDNFYTNPHAMANRVLVTSINNIITTLVPIPVKSSLNILFYFPNLYWL